MKSNNRNNHQYPKPIKHMKTGKIKSTSRIGKLTQAQRDKLEDLLFEQNLSFRAVSKLSLAEFGLVLQCESLKNFYHKTAQKRTLDRVLRSSQTTNAVVKAFTDNPAKIYLAILKVLGHVAFEKAIAAPDQLDVPQVCELTPLLISARREDLDSKKFLLDREKWEFDVARTCFDHHAELQALVADQSLDEDARLQAIRRSLFGENLPD